MPYLEKPVKKIYWTIGEVAKMIDQEPSAIRYWASEFKLRYKRGTRMSRMFNESDVIDMLAINYLLYDQYYTLKGAKIKFELWKRAEFEIPPEHIRIRR